jgi:hypothetical protein
MDPAIARKLRPHYRLLLSPVLVLNLPLVLCAATPAELKVGVAGHAFDHLAAYGEQAEAAAASGANIIYVTGLGGLGYTGLPSSGELLKESERVKAYLLNAKRKGIRLNIGYVCATSIVKLETFDKNWSAALRSQFHSSPADWRQQDSQGKALPSWYGGDYQPACMNNADWRAYEKFIVRQQLEAGCDGIFFDNPTIHPQGCYCPHCMERFFYFLQHDKSTASARPATNSLPALREFATAHRDDFLRFRCTIGRDFLSEIRTYARTINRDALITANNSFNSPEVLFSQCRTYGYNIYEMSKAEDFVVVEDQSAQPRALPNGQTLEYGPSYQQLQAIVHGKPLVAVTIAEGDYHTPPNLVRLAMTEAVAHNASYLSWPTWPENQRQRMSSLIRPQADFLKTNADLFADARPRRDVVLFLPFRNWLQTDQCRASRLAADLTRSNIQYEVICEDQLFPSSTPKSRPTALQGAQVFLVPALADLNPNERKLIDPFFEPRHLLISAEKSDWLQQVQNALPNPSLSLQGPPTVRASVCDQPKRTIVHLLNLNIQRLSSFEDKVVPALDVHVSVRVPMRKVRSVRALTADTDGSFGPLQFHGTPAGDQILVETTLPHLETSAMVVIE